MADFHFIRPYWLLSIVVLIFALYLLKKYRISQSGWHKLIPQHLAHVLIDGNAEHKSISIVLPFLIGLLAILALAGPTWKKLPQPVYQMARGSVLVMDMSYSMYSTDVSPNRLTRARYKAIDLLNQLNEGEMGLIAYAGDAFTISPLTEDVNNIELLLPSLSPELMPELGSNPYAALVLASEMLENAGHIEGDVYWFTDGIDYEDIQDIVDWQRNSPYRLNIMGVGTTSGAPIKLPNGQLLKDDDGSIVIPKLSENHLNTVAAQGSGGYARMSNNNRDIDTLVQPPSQNGEDKKTQSNQTGDQWQEFGPYLLIAVMLLLLPYFRRGNLLMLFPASLIMFSSPRAEADFWSDLWKTKDQQGQTLYNAEQYKEAASAFDNPSWKGSAYYRAGEYEEALSSFMQSEHADTNADTQYNIGNTLAKLQQIDQAIAAYDRALKLNPDHEDAKANKALLEKLKQQQEQQEQQENEQQDDQQNQNDKQESKDQQSDDANQGDQKEEEQSENQQQQSPEEQNPEKSEQEQQDKQHEEQQNDEKQGEPEQQEAQLSQAQQEKEMEQKHQQLLNKVTDDPYLLLRNKMQLEYQKRRQRQISLGAKKKW